MQVKSRRCITSVGTVLTSRHNIIDKMSKRDETCAISFVPPTPKQNNILISQMIFTNLCWKHLVSI